MDPFLGQILLFAGNFAPRGWALCEGQLLAINANQALFSILGTTYGGDGRTSFGLPDLRGRSPVSEGTGPGLTSRRLGEKGGTESNVISVAQMPAHTHQVAMPVNTGETGEAAGVLGNGPIYAEEATSGANYPGATSIHAGGGLSVNNIQPYLALNYIVALVGTFPSRN
jgi:microcystin-dependent protein